MDEDLLDGRYRLREVIGSGAFGTVRAAEHVVLGVPFRDVAVKFFGSGPGDSRPASPHAVLAEVMRLTTLVERCDDPVLRNGFVAVFDVGVGERPYVVMERALGDLAWWVNRTQHPVALAREHLLEIARPVAFMHGRGVVHLDLKPANVVVGRDRTLKVADFGSAARLSELLTGDPPRGTLLYQAPEVLEQRTPSAAADVYALGLIGYELLAGRLPDAVALRALAGDGEAPPRLDELVALKRRPVPPPGSINPGAAGDPFEEVLLRALDPLASRRHRDAAELCAALEAARGGGPDGDDGGGAALAPSHVSELVDRLRGELARRCSDPERLAALEQELGAAAEAVGHVPVDGVFTTLVRSMCARGEVEAARRTARRGLARRRCRDTFRAMAIACAETALGAEFDRRAREADS